MTVITAIEVMVLRNVRDNERTRGVTDANRKEHDAAVLSLIQRGLVHYNPKRPRQRFNLTVTGREALDMAEQSNAVVLRKLAKEWS